VQERQQFGAERSFDGFSRRRLTPFVVLARPNTLTVAAAAAAEEEDDD